MGSTRAALICQGMSGDLVVIIAYPTAAICSRKKKHMTLSSIKQIVDESILAAAPGLEAEATHQSQ